MIIVRSPAHCVLVLLCILVVPRLGEGASTWVISVANRPEVVITAASADAKGVPIVELSTIAATLNLTVLSQDGHVILRTEQGRQWRLAPESLHLTELVEGSPTSISAATIPGDAIFLPLSALADVCGMHLIIDRAGRAFLVERPAPVPRGTTRPATANGWEAIQVKKSDAELSVRQEPSATPDTPGPPDVLPPQYESVNVQTGIGFVAGEDWAGEVDATGTVAGRRVNGSLFGTVGPKGVEARHLSASIHSASGRWVVHAGDLLSELRGVARGVRVGWGLEGRWRHSVSAEQSRFGVFTRPWLAGYAAELTLLPTIVAGGEAASDGSVFLKARYARGRATLDGFWRRDRMRAARETGALMSYQVWSGVSLGAGARTSSLDERSYLLGANVNLKRFGSISLQQTRIERGDDRHMQTGLAGSLPLGPVRLFQRFGWSDVAFSQEQAGWRTKNQQLQSVASYSPTPRLHFGYQSVTQWYPGGTSSVWDEITGAVQISGRTSLYMAAAIPQVADPNRLRVRLSQSLTAKTSMSVEFGAVPTYQSTPAQGDGPRLLVMLRRSFGVRTPAHGANVTGRVLDETGRPVVGAAVRLGEYTTSTSASGAYAFRNVPPGQYDLALDPVRLPANYAAGADTRVALTSRTSATADLTAIPLNSISGRVYVDRNRNQQFDAGEEVGGAVIGLAERLTTTDSEGRYGFYNLPSGVHTVRVDRTRLRGDLEPVAGDVEVVLTPAGPRRGVDVLLKPKVKPVRMQGED